VDPLVFYTSGKRGLRSRAEKSGQEEGDEHDEEEEQQTN
jgi:hypothetical protein